MSSIQSDVNITSKLNSTEGLYMPLYENSIEVYVILVINILVFLIGTTGNAQVIRYFGCHFKPRRRGVAGGRSAEYAALLIHLALSDMIHTIAMPLHFVYAVLSDHVWHLGKFLCVVMAGAGPISILVSFWILVRLVTTFKSSGAILVLVKLLIP